MAEEFRVINTQEEFDAAVTERYGDVANLQQQVNTLTTERDTHANTIAQLQQQVKGYQTAELKQRIAKEKGIPMEMASRLSGETEKDLRADADAMAGTLKAYKGTAPLAEPDNLTESTSRTRIRTMLGRMKGE